MKNQYSSQLSCYASSSYYCPPELQLKWAHLRLRAKRHAAEQQKRHSTLQETPRTTTTTTTPTTALNSQHLHTSLIAYAQRKQQIQQEGYRHDIDATAPSSASYLAARQAFEKTLLKSRQHQQTSHTKWPPPPPLRLLQRGGSWSGGTASPTESSYSNYEAGVSFPTGSFAVHYDFWAQKNETSIAQQHTLLRHSSWSSSTQAPINDSNNTTSSKQCGHDNADDRVTTPTQEETTGVVARLANKPAKVDFVEQVGGSSLLSPGGTVPPLWVDCDEDGSNSTVSSLSLTAALKKGNKDNTEARIKNAQRTPPGVVHPNHADDSRGQKVATRNEAPFEEEEDAQGALHGVVCSTHVLTPESHNNDRHMAVAKDRKDRQIAVAEDDNKKGLDENVSARRSPHGFVNPIHVVTPENNVKRFATQNNDNITREGTAPQTSPLGPVHPTEIATPGNQCSSVTRNDIEARLEVVPGTPHSVAHPLRVVTPDNTNESRTPPSNEASRTPPSNDDDKTTLMAPPPLLSAATVNDGGHPLPFNEKKSVKKPLEAHDRIAPDADGQSHVMTSQRAVKAPRRKKKAVTRRSSAGCGLGHRGHYHPPCLVTGGVAYNAVWDKRMAP